MLSARTPFRGPHGCDAVFVFVGVSRDGACSASGWRSAAELAEELEVSESTIYRWKTHDEIDRGRRAGVSTEESAELQGAENMSAELNPSNSTATATSNTKVPGSDGDVGFVAPYRRGGPVG